MELKEQIKGELLKQKEEKLKKEKEINSKLKEITLYTLKNNTICENFKKFYKENNIKFIEKDLSLHTEVAAAVQLRQVPIIEIDSNYLVHQRDFGSPQQSIQVIRMFANPDYVKPSNDVLLIESIKNLNFTLKQSFQALNRQLMPMVKIMNELAQEEAEEKKQNAKKNK